MIRYAKGNILDEPADALVNTVNCVGVMGRGVARQFKEAFPANFKAYAAACRREEVQPGRMFVFDTGELTPPRYIINFPTKRHWRGKSRLEDIEAGLEALVEEVRSRGIKSIALPPLGSGLGGLEWSQVRPHIHNAMERLAGVDVVVFEPNGPSDTRANRSTPVPSMTPGRAALVGLMSRYLAGFMDPFITLLEVHKLLYFLQVAGEPLRLDFKKGLYGPYAENLRHVLRDIEGHLVSGYADGGDAPGKRLSIVPGAVDEAGKFLASAGASLDRFDRVARLVEGFETPFGMELLASVHWVGMQDGVSGDEAVTAAVHSWGPGKARFKPPQIRSALERLRAEGWLPVAGSPPG
jgi:O-acetyl-ADP-ribose deacetylase (regulator of RNase III)